MAKKQRHNAAFVVGSIVGGLVGAAAALWKTPYTGEELRAKMGLGDTHSLEGDTLRITPEGEMVNITASTESTTTAGAGRSLKDKVLSTVEHTLAPIVGVELGKTANDGGTHARPHHEHHPETSSMGPGAGHRPAAETTPRGVGNGQTGSPPAYPSDEPGYLREEGTVPQENVSPVDQGGGEPSDLSPATTSSGASEDDAASIEELTKPQIDLVPDALLQEEAEPTPFPKLGGLETDKR